MKKQILLYCVSAAVAFATVSCDKVHERTYFAGANGNELSFTQNRGRLVMGPEDVASEYTFEVVRNEASEPLDVVLEVSAGGDYGDMFTVPDQVSFPAGSYSQTLKITFTSSELPLGTQGVFTFAVPEENLPSNAGRYSSTTVTILRDYTWTPWATGKYISEYGVWDPDEEDWVEEVTTVLYKAEEGENLFQFIDLYNEGINLQFTWDTGNKATSIMPQGAAFTLSGNNPLETIRIPNGDTYPQIEGSTVWNCYDPDNTTYDPATKTFTLEYIPSVFDSSDSYAGNYGSMTDTFEIEEFHQGNPWGEIRD